MTILRLEQAVKLWKILSIASETEQMVFHNLFKTYGKIM